jgi:predicted nucleic acid-binding protein
VILVDSSAWIEFLRGTGSPVCDEVDRLLEREIAVTEPVVMEILAGARDDRHLHQLRGLLGRARLVHCLPGDFDIAATLYRRCRRQGSTVRRLIDCLIAAVAVREGLPVLHADADFDALARCTELRTHPAAA